MKIKSLLFLALMAISSVNAFAADDYKYNGVVYKLTEPGVVGSHGTAVVQGIRPAFLNGTDKVAVTIPKEVTDGDGVVYDVTSFRSDEWFSTAVAGASDGYETEDVSGKLKKLTIEIDNFAAAIANDYLNIASLEDLTLTGTSKIDGDLALPEYTGAGLKNLDLSAVAAKTGKTLSVVGFSGTLVTVKLPGKIDIPANTFNASETIKSVEGAGNVGANAFKGATNLEKFTFAGNDEAGYTIGANAFDGCTKLTSIDLSKVTEIGAEAFKAGKITAADLTKATNVGASAFEGCAEITTLEIPATLATIGADAFKGMTKLATLTINRNETNYEVPAVFDDDAAVTSLTLKGAESIVLGAFADMTALTSIDLRKCPELDDVEDVFADGLALTKIKLNGSKVSIADIDLTGAAASLKSISFSSDVLGGEIIPANTFAGFTKLATVTLPENLQSIGESAFAGSAVTAIVIPAGTQVGESAFAECAALASAEIGDGVAIGASAFAGSALATLSFSDPDENAATNITIGANAFEATSLVKVTLPANVTELGANAFKDCALLKTFRAENLALIPAAFDGCDKLSTVVIPGSVEEIAANAFKDLAKLATVTFDYDAEEAGEVLNVIGESAFEGCVALTAIDLSATKLAALNQDNVFKGCTALATITLPEEMDYLTGAGIFEGTAIAKLDASMVDWQGDVDGGGNPIPNVANIFGTDAENTNNTLKTLKLGDVVIAEDAFAYCTKLTTLTVGEAIINSDAFAYCEKLATVTVEAGVNTFVDESAFDHCTALTTFTYKPEDNLTLGYVDERAFTGCTPYVLFDTNNYWVDNNQKAPLNTTYGAELVATTVTTVQDKANANQFVNKFSSDHYNVTFNADDVKIYSVYVDGETAYFQACRTYNGKYFVEAGEHVILKTTEAKDVNYRIAGYAHAGWDDPDYTGRSSVAFDDIECLYDEDGELSDIQDLLGMGGGDYLYRLTNTASIGFGFTAYTGSTIKAGQFFISTTKKPANADRLNIVWLDEDGNVEGEATAIKKIDSADANDGAIYNMQGVRVENAQKGIYIQNGKKFVVK